MVLAAIKLIWAWAQRHVPSGLLLSDNLQTSKGWTSGLAVHFSSSLIVCGYWSIMLNSVNCLSILVASS